MEPTTYLLWPLSLDGAEYCGTLDRDDLDLHLIVDLIPTPTGSILYNVTVTEPARDKGVSTKRAVKPDAVSKMVQYILKGFAANPELFDAIKWLEYTPASLRHCHQA